MKTLDIDKNIHRRALIKLNLSKIHKRYFFESDMLFRLYCIKALVRDQHMPAYYGDETSGLSIIKVIPTFLLNHMKNFCKRIIYTYFLYNVSVATLCLVSGLSLFAFGGFFGIINWYVLGATNTLASSGTVMLAALPTILGFQLLLNFLFLDIESQPKVPLETPTSIGKLYEDD